MHHEMLWALTNRPTQLCGKRCYALLLREQPREGLSRGPRHAPRPRASLSRPDPSARMSRRVGHDGANPKFPAIRAIGKASGWGPVANTLFQSFSYCFLVSGMERGVFKGSHLNRSVILPCVRWYLAYNLSLRSRGDDGRARHLCRPCNRPSLGRSVLVRIAWETPILRACDSPRAEGREDPESTRS
jgi:hypothetical protein